MTFKELRNAVGMSERDYAQFAALDDEIEIQKLDAGSHPRQEALIEQLAKLDATIELAVIKEIDAYTLRSQRDAILVRFLNDDDFALYEPDLFEDLGTATVHNAFISRVKRAIERLGGQAEIAFMDSSFYEAWLGVNDFDDSRDLRIAWARQQMRGLSK
ncbi:MAG: hypothetical protein CBD27_00325 [Rhodospirillaceae bacterium TMED167]|nr:hypothetical protein [Rhodospirillaceae bacterium]OUW31153.1 MAG: hypothetical protein CBD27_00325 [Rhodospirillaceae bacterium TMED167]